MLSAAAMLMITMGGRQSMGLFIGPITQATGVGIVGVSFALAIGQFMWGAVQPVFGAIADQYGAKPVIFCGTLLLAFGYLLVPQVSSQFGLMLTMGMLVSSGAGAASFSILIGATASALPPEKRSFASGLINAGGSFGQFVFAPLAQMLIVAFGWITAMYSLAAASLLVIPLLLGLGKRQTVAASPVAGAAPNAGGLAAQLRVALRDRSYCCCTRAFLPAACTSHFWSRICRAKSRCVVCRPACRPRRWR
jgi:MFS family permease